MSAVMEAATGAPLDPWNDAFRRGCAAALSAVYAAQDVGSSVLGIDITGPNPRVLISPPAQPSLLPGAMRKRESRGGCMRVLMVAVRHGALIEWEITREVR